MINCDINENIMFALFRKKNTLLSKLVTLPVVKEENIGGFGFSKGGKQWGFSRTVLFIVFLRIVIALYASQY